MLSGWKRIEVRLLLAKGFVCLLVQPLILVLHLGFGLVVLLETSIDSFYALRKSYKMEELGEILKNNRTKDISWLCSLSEPELVKYIFTYLF